MYRTASWSGITRRPWRSVSSPVFAMTVRSPGGRAAWRPWASFAPPVPPARVTTLIGSRVEEFGDPWHAVDGLAVVRRGHPHDDGLEAEGGVIPDRVGHLGRAPEERLTVHRLDPVVGQHRSIHHVGGVAVVAQDDGEADGLLDRLHVAADVGAVLLEDVDPHLDVVERPARVPTVGPERHRSERLLRTGPTDEDRQVRLDRTRLAQRVVEPVEAAFVAEPLAVEESADEHHRLIEPVEPLTDRREVDGVGLMLAGETGGTDPQGRAAHGEGVERRGELRDVARIAERVGADHEPESNAAGEGSEAGKDAPAFEDGLLPRAEDRREVVPCPDAIPAHIVRGEGGVAEARPVGSLCP